MSAENLNHKDFGFLFELLELANLVMRQKLRTNFATKLENCAIVFSRACFIHFKEMTFALKSMKIKMFLTRS